MVADNRSPSTRVLIVGGGLAGLSAAMFLAWRGVPTILVEKRPGSSPHPRAVGFTTRTLELFRAVGIDSSIPQIPLGHGRPRRVAVESLAGQWFAEAEWNSSSSRADDANDDRRAEAEYSPCTGAAIAQDRLEPILRDKAMALGADVRLNTELLSFDQQAGAIVASLRRLDGHEYAVRADYMIAADGHASSIRDALGIQRSGHGFMQVVRSVLFRASLDEYLESGVSQFALDQPGLKGMLTTYRDGRWLLMFSDDEDRDEATLRAKVIQAVGLPDLAFDIVATGRWVLSALIADRFSLGRVFLAGDAAHTLPPARGGYGANTGIEDAFNLAWKLASVVSGVSSPSLLDTYDAERRPIAWLRHHQIFARQDYAAWATDDEKRVAIIDDDGMELGQLYRSDAVLGAGDDLPPAMRPEQWAGQPGTRAPHLWVSKGDAQFSTVDLLQRDWACVSTSARWCHAARLASGQLGLRVEILHVDGGSGGPGAAISAPVIGAQTLTLDTPIELIVAEPRGKAALDADLPAVTAHERYDTFKSMSLRQLQPLSRGLITDAALAQTEADLAAVRCHPIPIDAKQFRHAVEAAFGIGPEGVSLIRPDGYVAWRTREEPKDGAATLTSVLTRAASLARRREEDVTSDTRQ